MKKGVLTILSLTTLLSLSLNLSLNNKERTEKADAQEASNIVSEYYNNGVHTKKSDIFLSYAAKEEMAQYFHGTVEPSRTTYYQGNALFMADADGTYTNINSGYSTVTEANIEAVKADLVGQDVQLGYMTHYKLVDGSPVYNYVVSHDKQGNIMHDGIEDFYVSLKDFTLEGYFNEFEDGRYTVKGLEDQYLLDFLAYTAPCLTDTILTTNYLTAEGMVLEIGYGFNEFAEQYLSLRMYVSSGDESKVTSEVGLLSEARIYKGNEVFEEGTLTKLFDKVETINLTDVTTTFQGNTGTYKGLYIDATTGKYGPNNTQWAQFNEGTIIKLNVAEDAVVVANTYTAGIAEVVIENGVATITSKADDYISSITVNYVNYVKEDYTLTFGSDGNYSSSKYVNTVSGINFRDNGGNNTQIQGTFGLYVKEGATVSVSSYSNFTNYKVKINGEYATDEFVTSTSYSYTVAEDALVQFEGEDNNYFYSVSVTYPVIYEIGDVIDLTKHTTAIEGSKEIWKGIEIDATNGKWANNNGGWIQVNAGTIAKLNVEDGATVQLNAHTSTDNFTVEVEEGVVTITATANDYLKTITVIEAGYKLTVGKELNGKTTLSKSSGLEANEEVTATFTPNFGCSVMSYTVTDSQGSVKYNAYDMEEATIKVTENATVTAEYITNESYTSTKFTPYGDSGNIIWYNKDGDNKWTSGTEGTTSRTYSSVIGKVAENFDDNYFTLSADPLSTGKAFNTRAVYSEKNLYDIFGAKDDASKLTFGCKTHIYSVVVTYYSATHYNRATTYAGEEKVEAISLGSNKYLYLIDAKSFSIENASGNDHLYIQNIEIIHATHDNVYDYNDEVHWLVGNEDSTESHNLVNHLCECGYTDVSSFTVSPCGNSAILWYEKDKVEGAWASGTNGTTEQTEEYAIGRIRAGSSTDKMDRSLFTVTPTTADGNNGKWVNFSSDSTSYAGKEICLYGKADETSRITFTCSEEIYCVRIVYVNAVNATERSAVYAGEDLVEGNFETETVVTYQINGNTFAIENTGATYLYMYSIQIVYATPAE